MLNYVIQLTPLGLFSDRLHQVYYAYFNPKLAILQQLRFLLPYLCLSNPPCQLPCGRKPECPEKTQCY